MRISSVYRWLLQSTFVVKLHFLPSLSAAAARRFDAIFDFIMLQKWQKS